MPLSRFYMIMRVRKLYHETSVKFAKSGKASMCFLTVHLLIVFIIICQTAQAQIAIPRESISPIRIISMNPRVYKSHDTLYIYSGICKTLKITTLTEQDAINLITQNPGYKTPFITIKG